MLPDAPLPALDLSGMRCLHTPTPRAVLELLVDGLDPTQDLTNGWFNHLDDDDPQPPGFTCGRERARKTLPARKARDAWPLAINRGLVPASWLNDPRRCFPDQELTFFCQRCNGMGAYGYNYDDLCEDCGGKGNTMTRGRLAAPTAIDQVCWLLAHPTLVEQAESLARAAVQRTPHGPKPDRVQWGRVRPHKPAGTVGVIITSAIWDRTRVPNWDWDRMKGPAFNKTPWYPEARKLHELTRQVLCFDVGMAWTHAAMGITDSPFDPVLRLWELGVSIEEITADAIVLERALDRDTRSWRAHVPYG